jgi:hypothetical protein
MPKTIERAEAAMDPLVRVTLEADADRCVNQTVQLATITLMIEAGLITASQATQRIEALAQELGHAHLADEVRARIGRIVALVGSEARPPRWRPRVIEGGRAV